MFSVIVRSLISEIVLAFIALSTAHITANKAAQERAEKGAKTVDQE
jgi:hypothetical protein